MDATWLVGALALSACLPFLARITMQVLRATAPSSAMTAAEAIGDVEQSPALPVQGVTPSARSTDPAVPAPASDRSGSTCPSGALVTWTDSETAVNASELGSLFLVLWCSYSPDEEFEDTGAHGNPWASCSTSAMSIPLSVTDLAEAGPNSVRVGLRGTVPVDVVVRRTGFAAVSVRDLRLPAAPPYLLTPDQAVEIAGFRFELLGDF